MATDGRKVDQLRSTLKTAPAEILLRANACRDRVAASTGPLDATFAWTNLPPPDLALPPIEGIGTEVFAADVKTKALAVLEIAFLLAVVDGELDDAECELLVGAALELSDGELKREQIERTFGTFADMLARDGFMSRLGYVARAIPDTDARHAAFLLALSVFASGEREMSSVEEALLVSLRVTLGITREESKALTSEWVSEASGISPEEARLAIDAWEHEQPGMSDEDAIVMIDTLSDHMRPASSFA